MQKISKNSQEWLHRWGWHGGKGGHPEASSDKQPVVAVQMCIVIDSTNRSNIINSSFIQGWSDMEGHSFQRYAFLFLIKDSFQ